jgi:hypothetical protein
MAAAPPRGIEDILLSYREDIQLFLRLTSEKRINPPKGIAHSLLKSVGIVSENRLELRLSHMPRALGKYYKLERKNPREPVFIYMNQLIELIRTAFQQLLSNPLSDTTEIDRQINELDREINTRFFPFRNRPGLADMFQDPINEELSFLLLLIYMYYNNTASNLRARAREAAAAGAAAAAAAALGGGAGAGAGAAAPVAAPVAAAPTVAHTIQREGARVFETNPANLGDTTRRRKRRAARTRRGGRRV